LDQAKHVIEQTLPNPIRPGALETIATFAARFPLELAVLAQKYLPRAKGASGRWLGRKFVRPRTEHMTTRHGAKLVMSGESFDVYATMSIAGNAWDYQDFIILHIIIGSVMYDVGENVGYNVLEMVALSKGTVQVVAFEPQSDLPEAIRLNEKIGKLHKKIERSTRIVFTSIASNVQ
jgi:hypothetical protein